MWIRASLHTLMSVKPGLLFAWQVPSETWTYLVQMRPFVPELGGRLKYAIETTGVNTSLKHHVECFFLIKRSQKECISSVHFSRSVVSDSLQLHGLQHTRLPCPSPTPRVYSNSCPLSQWCHPTMSSSVFPFSSRLQSFPASGSFPMSQFFKSGGQSIGISASTSVLPMNIQDWLISFRMDCLDLLAVQGTLKSLLQHHSSKFFEHHSSIIWRSAFFIVQTLTSIHDYWKNYSFD